MTEKQVYFFGNGQADGSAKDKMLLGGKGANLAEMTNLGLPVPPGFTITTKVCHAYQENGGRIPESLYPEVEAALAKLEQVLGARFGDAENPLLLSVRSGAPVSMPGMMDTILNLGLNDEVVEGLARKTGNRRFAYDSYRRLLAMYGDVVMEMKAGGDGHSPFENALTAAKRKAGVEIDSQLTDDQLVELVDTFKSLIRQQTGQDFPQKPWEQLLGATRAVFRSFTNPRANAYRKFNNIPADIGTAVNVQAMVFGNMGETSGTGVAFSRDPNTGEKRFFGEYLMNAQGEDVVAGTRTPANINGAGTDTLEARFPAMYAKLDEMKQLLEKHYRDMQDIEFTIQNGDLYLLQTRSGKRTAAAAVKMAVDMVHEGLIDKKEAVRRVTPSQVDQLLHPMLDPQAARSVIAKGLPASPGAATGVMVFSSAEAEERGKRGEKVILVRIETSPEDVTGMHHSAGILTSRGGMTSHAAVVARGMGRPCVVGCSEISIDYAAGTINARGRHITKGSVLTIDGSTGEVMLGEVATIQASGSQAFEELMGWADEYRRLRVRTNADTPADAATARKFGAEGIGLCRTEHMFFAPERIGPMREMILADSETGRRAALAKLEPMQKEDFRGIFEAMAGYAVTIRLLDPPLHEFLPTGHKEIELVAKVLGRDFEVVRAKIESLHEQNPMLGLRGCRLGLKHPEIYEMQVRAIIEAAVEVKRSGLQVQPEIMIPLVAEAEELRRLREMVVRVAEQVFSTMGASVDYLIGTMIEIPRAAITADKVAEHADFFSFGTNDLTQMTFGISRDDSATFVPAYVQDDIFKAEPFQVLDQLGVGALIEIAVQKGRGQKSGLKVGICGEHGGEPSSVAFCHRTGLDYVSCSPFRVPIARLAAARAALEEQR